MASPEALLLRHRVYTTNILVKFIVSRPAPSVQYWTLPRLIVRSDNLLISAPSHRIGSLLNRCIQMD